TQAVPLGLRKSGDEHPCCCRGHRRVGECHPVSAALTVGPERSRAGRRAQRHAEVEQRRNSAVRCGVFGKLDQSRLVCLKAIRDTPACAPASAIAGAARITRPSTTTSKYGDGMISTFEPPSALFGVTREPCGIETNSGPRSP